MEGLSELPETRYARTSDGSVAYQVVGTGPIDLVFIQTWVANIDVMWEQRLIASFLQRLAAFCRLIVFNKRGTGVSDPLPQEVGPTLESWMDDVGAVMDAAGSERAAVFGHGVGAQEALLFAGAHPERVSSLVLLDGFARLVRDSDYPAGMPDAAARRWANDSLNTGTERGLGYLAPSLVGDARLRTWWARYVRLSVRPVDLAAVSQAALTRDVRPVLATIKAPTLILQHRDGQFIRAGHGKHLADAIHNARYVELPGADYLYFAGDTDQVIREVREFLTGTKEVVESDRILATVLFTDIVDSTKRATELGDRKWRALLSDHNALVRRELERFRGHEVKTVGDGFVATFDGPARAVRCALAIGAGLREIGIDVRAGLHAGEVEIGADDIQGIAVHIGARVVDLAGPGEVLVSSTVKDLVAGSEIRFKARGSQALKGVAGRWRLFSAEQ
jgi:class 3 adenylate cyclase